MNNIHPIHESATARDAARARRRASAELVDPCDPVFDGVRGRVLAVLCTAEHPLSGGQVATVTQAARSTAHGCLNELVEVGIVRDRVYPSVTLFELHDNAVARSIETLHDPSARVDEKRAAVMILRHVLPQWTQRRRELDAIAS